MPTTIFALETKIIRSLSRPQLTDPIVKVLVSQLTDNPSFTNPIADRGKGIARDTDESPRKPVKASREAYLEKEEQIEKAAREARLMQLSKP
ncbi:hypothetical protein Tco_1017110 [Tanacetum coccineum]|uniref:Uncharacterized protein n=1 Tax=Tanacetum coccineum TaxID=301880 RepID=A0ABQ5FQJ2_9ASTR